VSQSERLTRLSEILIELFRSPIPTHFFQVLADEAAAVMPHDFLAVCLADQEKGGYLVADDAEYFRVRLRLLDFFLGGFAARLDIDAAKVWVVIVLLDVVARGPDHDQRAIAILTRQLRKNRGGASEQHEGKNKKPLHGRNLLI